MLAVVIGRAAPLRLRVENNAVVIRAPSYVTSSCARGAAASAGVAFKTVYDIFLRDQNALAKRLPALSVQLSELLAPTNNTLGQCVQL